GREVAGYDVGEGDFIAYPEDRRSEGEDVRCSVKADEGFAPPGLPPRHAQSIRPSERIGVEGTAGCTCGCAESKHRGHIGESQARHLIPPESDSEALPG